MTIEVRDLFKHLLSDDELVDFAIRCVRKETKPKVIFVNNSNDAMDRETVDKPILIVIDPDTKKIFWTGNIIARTMKDIELMKKLKIVYTSDIEVGKTVKINDIILYGTTHERVIYAETIEDKEKSTLSCN
ncbi:hypothetical protein [Bacillus weihaiensis]|uniref:Uncharacterized protein n=1 Tax=Bacillus weihaiensis TaxID=1547283 RepID=A0A1L3MXZ0_9BACI|nr:hypothetical protein [Bacillus weihaiensis]APH07202.1 hypothetical protein A9C19_20660 [Bacillus weihaiensis]